jgi:hypothetical protein
MEQLTGAMGEEAQDKVIAAGAQLSLDEAVALALSDTALK